MKSQSSQAEVKPSKFGELSASKVGDNPEPSTAEKSAEACVETRRKVCIKCGGDIPPEKYSNAKYCSNRCRSAFISLRHAQRTGRIKNPNVGSGGAQQGQANHQYKTGIGMYTKLGFDTHGRICKRCGATATLIHHKDHNRLNNQVDNLEPLCKRCHQDHHCVRDLGGKYTKG